MAKSKRYFRHDIFLSHNQKDGSLVLRDELLKRDVEAWHDGDADMSDRNVLELVRGALDDSRFICVCVRHGFRDSDWVKTEYERGLELARKSGACCVIVAEMTPDAVIPEALQNQPRFRLYADGIEPLAKYVRAANHRKPIEGEHLVPDAPRLRSDGVKLRSIHGLQDDLWRISEDERAKLFIGNLRATSSDSQLPAYGLFRILQRKEYIKRRELLLEIYELAAARDDVLAEAARARGDDQHYPLEILLHPLSEFARDPAYRDQACALHERILSRVAALHNLSPAIVHLFRRYHAERLADRWVDTRKPRPPEPKRRSDGMSLGDFGIMLLGCVVVLAGVGILFMMLTQS